MVSLKWIRRNILLLFTILSVTLGVIIGFSLRSVNLGDRAIATIEFPGKIFMRMLQLLILPLITSSIITGLASLNRNSSGRIFAYSFTYYGLTTIFAAIVGAMLVLTIRPGVGFGRKDQLQQRLNHSSHSEAPENAVMDLLFNAIPDNIVRATFQQYETIIETDPKDGTITRTGRYGGSMDIVGVVVFSITVGLILGSMGDEAKQMVDLLKTVESITMKAVSLIMWYSPIGIMSLIIVAILKLEDIQSSIISLGWYILTVCMGQALYLFIVFPCLYLILTRRNPFHVMKGIMEAMITAFVTSSSAATLPITIKCCEKNMKLDSRITHFVLPVGSSINMNGTALYEAVSAIFIAQINNVSLSLIQVAIISLTTTVTSMGAATVPGAGVMELMIVLGAVGLPADDIALIIGVDVLLDRVRTAVNIVGDAYGAAIVDHLCQDKLDSCGDQDRFVKENEFKSTKSASVRPLQDTKTPVHVYDGPNKGVQLASDDRYS
ncbi:hypothetical protein AB6A40_005224 [Gnathostoma spinigerum]|uniref:Amino acid transporter n=1 Tax=Gnathostoma spinigerum TaxID=75299 RepID=A0ABD6EET2_9BILA